MYLGVFSDEEKSAFFSLAKSLVNSDNVVAENEVALLNQYLVEMGMDITQIIPLSFDESIDVFCHSELTTRRKVYVELFGLAMCDSDFAQEEKELLLTIADKLDISEQAQSDIQNCVIDLLAVYSRMNELVK